jgi:two-component system, NtrC family, sensor histidine kinase GlrK
MGRFGEDPSRAGALGIPLDLNEADPGFCGGLIGYRRYVKLFQGDIFSASPSNGLLIMRLTIFSRLILGYLLLFALIVAVSVYAILKLHEFNVSTRHILNIDNRVLDYEETLSHSLLGELRYEKKFVITGDRALYEQFEGARDEFNKALNGASAIVDTPDKREVLDRIRANHRRYQSLVAEEVGFLREKRPYGVKWYEREKEKATDNILEDLEKLEEFSRKDIYGRMKTLRDAGGSAWMLAIIMAGVALLVCVVISVVITRSITKPLNGLMEKTKEISAGVFNCNLDTSSLPEVSALIRAFNSMCDRLRDVDRMKSEFFSTMSHELRTPLTSIKEGTSLLLDGVGGPTTDKQKKLLSIISAESRRLIELVNSVLDLSKMEAGMMTYRLEPGSLAPLIHQAVSEIGPLAESKKISLATKVEEGMPLTRFDGERLLQVLRNLLGNAVKFTPDGGNVTVSARMVNREVEVSVIDTGPGIPSNSLTAIFNKFEQGPPTGPRGMRGTGLGLAISKHIILSHGGRIWAESELGRGSTFIFVLPL